MFPAEEGEISKNVVEAELYLLRDVSSVEEATWNDLSSLVFKHLPLMEKQPSVSRFIPFPKVEVAEPVTFNDTNCGCAV